MAYSVTRCPPASVVLNPLMWLLFTIDLVLWLLFPFPLFGIVKMFLKCCEGKASFESAEIPGSRTRTQHGKLIETPFPGCTTMHEVCQKAFKDYGPLKALGTREFMGMVTKEGEKFPRKGFGDTSWKTYAEVGEEAKAFGAGLIALGLKPLPTESSKAICEKFEGITGPNCLLVYEETSAVWTTACMGAMSQSIPVATSYATLGIDAVGEALGQTMAPAIMCNYTAVKALGKLVAGGGCDSLKTCIYTRKDVARSEPALTNDDFPGMKVISFDEVVALGKANPVAFAAPSPESLGLIMYTSGSTGKPKGVMLTHKSITAAAGGLEGIFNKEMGTGRGAPGNQEVYLAYLPAAHILEFSAEMSMIAHGSMIGYSCTRSIASTGAARMLPDGSFNFDATGFGNNPSGGIQEFAPTVMAGVPKIWDIFKKGIEAKMGASGVLGYIFQGFYSWTSFAKQQGRSTPLCNRLWGKIGGALGGRIKVGLVGGGPTHPDLQNFVRCCMGFNLVQGYALTETCSAGTVQPFRSVQDGVAGSPVECVQIKLKSETDIKDKDGKPYLITDRSHYGAACIGRGEACIKGAPVSSGYYMMEDKTREEFDSEGWFHSGDVAIWTSNGMLKIVDRIKNLVKLKGGEYIAIEAMESTYCNSVFVDGKKGGIMCYGDGDMDKPIALIMVDLMQLKKWAGDNGVGVNESTLELCKNPKAIKAVLDDLVACGKSGGLGRNELLKAVGLCPGVGQETDTDMNAPWTPANQYLTASMKLNRKPILAGFEVMLKPLIASASS